MDEIRHLFFAVFSAFYFGGEGWWFQPKDFVVFVFVVLVVPTKRTKGGWISDFLGLVPCKEKQGRRCLPCLPPFFGGLVGFKKGQGRMEIHFLWVGFLCATLLKTPPPKRKLGVRLCGRRWPFGKIDGPQEETPPEPVPSIFNQTNLNGTPMFVGWWSFKGNPFQPKSTGQPGYSVWLRTLFGAFRPTTPATGCPAPGRTCHPTPRSVRQAFGVRVGLGRSSLATNYIHLVWHLTKKPRGNLLGCLL